MEATRANYTEYSKTTFKLQEPKNQKNKAFGRTLLLVENVFPKLLLDQALIDIPKQPYFPNSVSDNNIVTVNMGLASRPENRVCAHVNFDSEGNLINQDDLNPCFGFASDALKDLTVAGVCAMAKIVKFSDMTVDLTTQILRYQPDGNNPQIVSLPWHQETNSLSMTVLISPQKPDDGYFDGGQLNFAECKSFIMNDYYEDTIQTFEHPHNGGFIFDNINSTYKVSDINFKSLRKGQSKGKCEIQLFTVFANPSKQFVQSLPMKLRNMKCGST